jgi:cellulose 1,4-beta-cellobiosidase
MNLTNGQTYYYIVTAVNAFGESLASTEVNAAPGFPVSSPSPPALLSVASGIGQNAITWSPVTGATYNLYWSAGPIIPDRTMADNVIRGITIPSYIHSTLVPTSCYIVTAVSLSGESADSMQVCSGSGSVSIVW